MISKYHRLLYESPLTINGHDGKASDLFGTRAVSINREISLTIGTAIEWATSGASCEGQGGGHLSEQHG